MVTSVKQSAKPDSGLHQVVLTRGEEMSSSVFFWRDLLDKDPEVIVNGVYPQGYFGYRPQPVDLLEQYGFSNICGYVLAKLHG